MVVPGAGRAEGRCHLAEWSQAASRSAGSWDPPPQKKKKRNGGANARFRGIFLHRRPDFIFGFLKFEVIRRFFQ